MHIWGSIHPVLFLVRHVVPPLPDVHVLCVHYTRWVAWLDIFSICRPMRGHSHNFSVTLPSPRIEGDRLPGETARVRDHSPRGPAELVAETLRTSGQLWCKRVAPPRGPRPAGLRRSTGLQAFILPSIPLTPLPPNPDPNI